MLTQGFLIMSSLSRHECHSRRTFCGLGVIFFQHVSTSPEESDSGVDFRHSTVPMGTGAAMRHDSSMRSELQLAVPPSVELATSLRAVNVASELAAINAMSPPIQI